MLGSYTYTPNIWPSLLTVLLLLVLAIYSWHRRARPGALPFTIGCLLAGLWVTGSVFRYAALDVSSKIWWYKFESLWQLSAITVLTCFVLEYVWPGRWLTRRNLILLAIVPLLDIALILTNDLHHLEWRTLTYDGFIIPRQGLVGWFTFAYSYSLSTLNIIVLVWLFWRSPQHRLPVVIMLTGIITVRIVYLLGAFEILHSHLPLDTLGIGFSFLMYAIVLFGFRFFDPIPLARQTVIEQLHTGVLVLDPKERVVSLNRAAEAMLGKQARQAKGQHIKDLLPTYPEGHIDDFEEIEAEFSLNSGEGIRHYLLSISRLKDFRRLSIGRLLMLRDVSEQKLTQAKILEQQRALAMLHERERLARELHDSLGQIFAFVNTQGQAANRMLKRGDIPTAKAYIERLVNVAREADLGIRESILGLRASLSEKGFFSALAQYLSRYEKNFGIRAELLKPDGFEDGVLEPLVEVQLLRILQEALTNVRKHSKAHNVQITFDCDDGWVCVTVKDDGKGFSIGSNPGKEDEHVGLGVMRERAEDIGGSLTLSSVPGAGTEVVVRMPLKREVEHD